MSLVQASVISVTKQCRFHFHPWSVLWGNSVTFTFNNSKAAWVYSVLPGENWLLNVYPWYTIKNKRRISKVLWHSKADIRVHAWHSFQWFYHRYYFAFFSTDTGTWINYPWAAMGESLECIEIWPQKRHGQYTEVTSVDHRAPLPILRVVLRIHFNWACMSSRTIFLEHTIT